MGLLRLIVKHVTELALLVITLIPLQVEQAEKMPMQKQVAQVLERAKLTISLQTQGCRL